MTVFSERDDISILDGAVDPENDPLTITEINGSAALVGAPVALSVGGSLTVQADGSATFDDTGFGWPAQGGTVNDSIIATASDGSNDVFVSVNLAFNTP